MHSPHLGEPTPSFITDKNLLIGQEFMAREQAQAILRRVVDGTVHYEDLIGSKHHSPAWDDFDDGRKETDPYRLHDHERARKGLRCFFQMFTGEFTSQVGLSQPPETFDFSNSGNMEGLIETLQTTGVSRISRGSMAFMPSFHYQTPRQPQQSGQRQREDFLHFGISADNSENPTKLSPEFDSSVRIYMNPTIERTPETVAIICRRLIDEMGYLPSGKFAEDVTSWRVEERNDRVLFWAKTPRELTAVLRITNTLQEQKPELFLGREPIVLGEPVIINGKELPTVRVAQEPPVENFSYSKFCRLPINEAVQAAFQPPVVNALDPSHISIFIKALQHVAPSYDRHPESFSFNTGQDLGVINRSIAAAA